MRSTKAGCRIAVFCPSLLTLSELLVDGATAVAEVGLKLVLTVVLTTPPTSREVGAVVLTILEASVDGSLVDMDDIVNELVVFIPLVVCFPISAELELVVDFFIFTVEVVVVTAKLEPSG
jgi:hypothetical protein